MRIVIDMEGAQRELSQPGEQGASSLSVVRELVRTRGEHEVVLLVSDLFPDTIEPLREMFRGVLDARCFHIWYCAAFRDVLGVPFEWRLACAALIKEAATASLKPTLVVNETSFARSAESIWEEARAQARPVPDASHLMTAVTKPRLAWLSPLPPERSGIADYTAMLLPALSRFYDIDVVAPQQATSDRWIAEHCKLRTPEWFAQNHSHYQRVVYHFGNSAFHTYMFDLLERVPGIVVLHDFFLGDIQLVRERGGSRQHAWARALYESHGYRAVMERFDESLQHKTLSSYPANFDVLRNAQGVVVHSEYARGLADEFYGRGQHRDWAVVPLAREPRPRQSRLETRARLGIAAEDFVVCSVGYMNPAKLHDRILKAWTQSGLSRHAKCRLFFVGGGDGPYGEMLAAAAVAPELGGRVTITGWVDAPAYHDYLAAADLAVQLRMHSRGETSAAALDCMCHGVATIVNANGSMAELPADTVHRLPDAFTDSELVQALESLWTQPEARARLGERALKWIEERHATAQCAASYAQAFERICAIVPPNPYEVARALGTTAANAADAVDHDFAALAQSLAKSFPRRGSRRQLLVDVSAIVRDDLKTGIQRVVRALVWELIQAPPPGFAIEPVYMVNRDGAWEYRYARDWTCGMLGIEAGWAEDDVAEYAAGDVLLIADFTSVYLIQAQPTGMLQAMRNAGVEVNFIVYDLLPLQMPDKFPPGTADLHESWFRAATAVADRAICISQSVAREVNTSVHALAPHRAGALKVGWFHLGANLDRSKPSGGMPPDSAQVLAELAARPSFLMVSTVEPRKGHAQTLAAFEHLWAQGRDVNLVIVGKQGWMVDALCSRLRGHPQAGTRLFWVEGASDEYLRALYGACSCLVAASEGEGFGLPLIEAAQHGLSIIARDLAVFKEVAGEFACYFSGPTTEALADCVDEWLKLRAQGRLPDVRQMPSLTWQESARQLVACLEV